MDFQAPFRLYESGQFEESEEAARQALASGGEEPALRHLLGVLLCRSGRLAEGAAEFERALAKAPGHPGIRVMLVRSLIDLDRSEDALGHALRPAPGPLAAELWRLRAEAAEAADALGLKLDALRHVALATVEKRLADEGAGVALLLDRARLLGVLRRDEEAIGTYRSILATSPANANAARELGLLYERSSRIDELAGLIDKADGAGIARPDIALLRAYLAWRQRRAGETLSCLDEVPAGQEPVRAAQLATKAHDSLGHAAEAMSAAARKNRAVADHEQWRGEAARHLERMRAYAEVITPEWAESWTPDRPAERKSPIFLIGFPRSGTTLLDTFLMGHPDVAVIEEMPFFDAVAAQAGPVERLASLSEQEIADLRMLYFKAMDMHVPDGFAGVVVDKMPLNMMCAPLIRRLFPDAKFLFAQRHPCDCVLSGYLQSFNLNASTACFLELADAAALYDVAMDIWSRSKAGLALDSHTVVYEQMVERPEEVMRALLAYLDVEWHAPLMDHRSTARARGAVPTASYDQVTETLNASASGRWRRYGAWLDPVLPVLMPWAVRLGYRDEAVKIPN